ncbi:DUF3422 domain-containing protein [Pelomonas sp. CA6]|uniref:DUF3422 family protein n=1 Tax=Pelomonas sp. CA6 TaxID=2907999 RepID=UPI001F4A29A4|nr:DUF3422 domain-containing protein [Pelomonas sp. CA6]MCH7342566.1 DUF3422 domain-containing protein [Pelomonas sp. CA6]
MCPDDLPPPPATAPAARLLPPDDAQRALLHNEIHARPSARIRLPALIVYVAVLNEGVSREDECAHLRRLPGQQDLAPAQLAGNFLRLRLGGHTVKWERHTEFTRYSIVQPLPPECGLGQDAPTLGHALRVDPAWLAAIPGRTVAAIQLALVEHELSDAGATLGLCERWLGGDPVKLASMMGAGGDMQGGHSLVMTDLRLRDDGFERMLVLMRPGASGARAGRIAQRLMELETYRLMALRGLPVAKSLAPTLGEAEAALQALTDSLVQGGRAEQALLDTLLGVAAQVERATAQHAYRFSATQAYEALVQQRIAELRERPLQGYQTLGVFVRRRFSPAAATVAATAQRLASLSLRIERSSALLRTQVDIAREAQNQELLAKLTRGQSLQLQLQSTVEGLSIAAISYYVVSLLLYGGKAAKSAGLPVNPELAAGALIPLVLWSVWKATQRIHRRLHDDGH